MSKRRLTKVPAALMGTGMFPEPVSRPLKDSGQASELEKAEEEVITLLVTDDQSPKAMQPADRAFDLPTVLILPQLAFVLYGRLRAVLAVRTNQFDEAVFQPGSQRIAVGGFVLQ